MAYNKDPRNRSRQPDRKPDRGKGKKGAGSSKRPETGRPQTGRKSGKKPPPPPKPARETGKTVSAPKAVSSTEKKAAKTGKGCCLGVVIAFIAVIGILVLFSLMSFQRADEGARMYETVQQEQREMLERQRQQIIEDLHAEEISVEEAVRGLVEADPQTQPVDGPEKEDPLAGALKDMKSTDVATVRRAMRELRKHTKSEYALLALTTAAMSHGNENVRFDALHALAAFREVDHRKVCDHAIRKEGERLAKSALNLAANVQFYGYGESVVLGLDHAAPGVREWSLRTLGSHQLNRYEDRVARVAANDESGSVRVAALNALTRWKSEKALPLLRTMIADGQKRQERMQAYSLLVQWQEHDGALNILQRHREDQYLGYRIDAHLKRYGR